MNKINVGIIGTGIIADEHAKAIRAMDEAFILVKAFDMDSEKLQKFVGQYPGVMPAQTLDEVLGDTHIDLIVVATPPSTHESLVIAALEAGKYVLCEKPLSNSMKGALQIAQASQKFPGRLAVGYQMRYDASFRHLKQICKNRLGIIQSVRIARHSYIPHRGGGWWGSWSIAGGGVLITQLIHEIDLLIQLMGKPLSVKAQIDTRYAPIESEDMVEAELFFDEGRVATISASVNSGVISGEFKVSGHSGDASLSQVPESLLSRGTRFLKRRLGMKQDSELTAHAHFYTDIAKGIRAGRPLPVSANEAMDSLEVCMAIYESGLSGLEVKLPLKPDCQAFDGISKHIYDRRPKSSKSTPVYKNASMTNGQGLKIGLLGLDTSHAITFAKILHDPYNPLHIPGAKITAAWPGGSPDMKISASRVKGFTDELCGDYGIPIMKNPQEVAEKSDVIFILGADGRTHPGLLRAIAPFGKPVFIDKPFALSVGDARDMFGLAQANKLKIFTSSAFRYADGLVNALDTLHLSAERIESCEIHCWLPIEPTQGRYFWYGIHASEMLLAIMGGGIQDVVAEGTDLEDKIYVRHRDGRKSCINGSRNNRSFKVKIITLQGEMNIDLAASTDSLSVRLLQSALDVLTEGHFPRLWRATESGSVSGFRPGRFLDPAQDETMEVVRLLEAAQESFTGSCKTTL